MNEQLPPIDSDLREHLARRSAGRLPGELAAEVFTALDSAPIRRPIWRVPRLAVAGLSLALVAVLVVAIAFSAVRTPPAASAPSLAGYPAERALTTAELSSLMAGPALSVNTALVASVTIDVRNDVCPMNRYQTQGLVEGMGSQVCVMTADVAVQPTTLTGTFAFRYLAPGYLGMLGGIAPASPASSRLALQVADSWPDTGGTFLVDGWLGAVELTASCAGAPTTGDVLAPNGEDCPYDNWLGDGPVAAGIVADHEYTASSPQQSYDPLSLRGNARHVEAGGMRLIDSIDHAAPVRGTYVVRPVTGPCPGAEPQASRGCSTWRVLAKLADITMTAPTASTPTPTNASPATSISSPAPSLAVAPAGLLGPNNRVLNPAELSALIAADPNHLSGRYVIDERVTCDGTDCTGFAPKAVADTIGSNGQIGLVGPVNVRPDDSLVWTIPQVIAALPGQPGIYLVDAWISGAGMVSCDVAGSPCYETSWLAPTASELWLGSPAFGQRLDAQLGAYHQFGQGQVGGGAAIHGLFLFEWVPGGKCGVGVDTTGLDTCSPHAQILARLEPAVLP